MAVGDAHELPGFYRPVPTQLFFPKPQTIFLTCFSRGERRKYAGKKVGLNWVSNSQPPGHGPETLTTELPRRGAVNSSKFHCRDLVIYNRSKNSEETLKKEKSIKLAKQRPSCTCIDLGDYSFFSFFFSSFGETVTKYVIFYFKPYAEKCERMNQYIWNVFTNNVFKDDFGNVLLKCEQ